MKFYIELYFFQEFEKDENFELFIESVSKGAKMGHLSRTVITIVNDDGRLLM